MMDDVLLLRTVDDRSTTPLTTRNLIPMQTLSLDQVSKDIIKLNVVGVLIIIVWEMLVMTKAMTVMMMPSVITMT